MKTIQTIAKNKMSAFIVLVLAVTFAVSGLLAVQNNPSHVAATVVVKSSDKSADSAATVDSPARVVENRMTEEAQKAAATSKAKVLGTGEASYYGAAFAGRSTANGERFNPAEMTAAHRTLPFGSKLRVTNTRNGRSVVVRVNDRGPYAHNRVLDLSKGAAKKIGMIDSGTANVKLELIS